VDTSELLDNIELVVQRQVLLDVVQWAAAHVLHENERRANAVIVGVVHKVGFRHRNHRVLAHVLERRHLTLRLCERFGISGEASDASPTVFKMENADLMERSTMEGRDIDASSMRAWDEVGGNVFQCVVIESQRWRLHVPRTVAASITAGFIGLIESDVAVLVFVAVSGNMTPAEVLGDRKWHLAQLVSYTLRYGRVLSMNSCMVRI
jgi:hypothetical protein